MCVPVGAPEEEEGSSPRTEPRTPGEEEEGCGEASELARENDTCVPSTTGTGNGSAGAEEGSQRGGVYGGCSEIKINPKLQEPPPPSLAPLQRARAEPGRKENEPEQARDEAEQEEERWHGQRGEGPGAGTRAPAADPEQRFPAGFATKSAWRSLKVSSGL